MFDRDTPTSDEDLVARINAQLAKAHSARENALNAIVQCDAEQARLGHHPNHNAYVPGGMLAERGFGSGHILAIAGLHALDWREALARLATRRNDAGDEACLLTRLRLACEADPMLEVAGYTLLAEFDLLNRGRLDPFWLRRPKLGLGQAAKAFGLEPAHADGHRGLYALDLPALRRGCEKVGDGQADQRFGALLLPLIETGGERLAEIGARAFHADAEARYRKDCRRFEEHQRQNPSRRWRCKPPLSRQGHLAITTARAKDIPLQTARTRGHAANWLDDHDANVRFTREDQA
jgi:hypothetical protein